MSIPQDACDIGNIIDLNLASSSSSSQTGSSSGGNSNTSPVLSVFGRTGNVVAVFGDYNTSLVPEGTNLYFTVSRVRDSINANAPLNFNTSTGVISITKASNLTDGYLSSEDWNTFNNKQNSLGFTPENVSNKSTTLTGSNNTTYPTTQAVVNALNSLITGVSSVFGRSGVVTAQNGDYNTSQVTESVNLYFTTARARNSVSASSPLVYNEVTGQFYIQQATNSQNGFLSSTDWNTFNNKQNLLSFGNITSSGALSVTNGNNRVVGGNVSLSFSGASNQLIRGDGSFVANLYYVNGGNAYSANATIGLTDAFNLSFITNNVIRATISNLGNMLLGTTSGPTSTTRLDVIGLGTSATTLTARFANTSNPILTIRDDGEIIIGSPTFGPRIRSVNNVGALSLNNGQSLGFRKFASVGQGFPDFVFDTDAVTAVDSDGQMTFSIRPTWTNTSFNRFYTVLDVFGNVTTNGLTNIVRGIHVRTNVTNGDFRAIETASGRHIFNGSQDWALASFITSGTFNLTSANAIVEVDASAGNITLTLSSGTNGRIVILKRTDVSSNNVIINPFSGTINGATSLSLFGSLSVWLYWNNSLNMWRTF